MAENDTDFKPLEEDGFNGSQDATAEMKVQTNEESIRVTDRRFWAQPQGEEQTAESSYTLKPTFVEELERKLSDSQKKLEDVLSTYREFKAEAASETQKARERIQNEFNRRLIQARADVASKFVGVLENLERALAASLDAQSFDGLLEGVHLIRKQFASALYELGVREVGVMGEAFNPEISEAIGTIEVESETEEDHVQEVVSKGYQLGEMLVRPAKVRVGKLKAQITETAAS